MIEIISPSEATSADVVVCVLYRAEDGLMLPDNVLDRCSECHRRVQLRPYVPKQPKRVCVECLPGVLERNDDEHAEAIAKLIGGEP
jgi:hypothetical protein